MRWFRPPANETVNCIHCNETSIPMRLLEMHRATCSTFILSRLRNGHRPLMPGRFCAPENGKGLFSFPPFFCVCGKAFPTTGNSWSTLSFQCAMLLGNTHLNGWTNELTFNLHFLLLIRKRRLLKSGDAAGWLYVRQVFETLQSQDHNYINCVPIRVRMAVFTPQDKNRHLIMYIWQPYVVDVFLDLDLQEGLLCLWEDIHHCQAPSLDVVTALWGLLGLHPVVSRSIRRCVNQGFVSQNETHLCFRTCSSTTGCHNIAGTNRNFTNQTFECKPQLCPMHSKHIFRWITSFQDGYQLPWYPFCYSTLPMVPEMVTLFIHCIRKNICSFVDWKETDWLTCWKLCPSRVQALRHGGCEYTNWTKVLW